MATPMAAAPGSAAMPMPNPAAASAASEAVGFVLQNVPSFGALEVGTSVAMMFLGIATLQTWNYFRDFPKDPSGVKLLVAAVYLADFIHSILFIHMTYQLTITGFVNLLTTGNPAILVQTPWSLQASVMVIAVIIFLVQAYFSLRVLRITQSNILGIGCFVLSVARLGLNVGLEITVVRTPTIAVVETQQFKSLVVSTLTIGTFTDIVVAAAICIALLRRRTGLVTSNHIVDRVVAYTVGSGLATSIVSVVELVTYVTMPRNYVWMVFFSIISKVFSNSLLASLNQRTTHRVVTLSTMSTSGPAASSNFDFQRRGDKEYISALEMGSVTDSTANSAGKPATLKIGVATECETNPD
ncbi:hypothetical protein EXIGLDRAFT_201707 [Exidia glandulosa HHB12029]|uniref:DUF6534 domain-containing protein n=1 Tax=Exidia glandulosa HHB12029 TaxID=1314781 RepID=A0A165EQB0_EXIGL|nr:hypothetical protein EXIGLDRAFT_201707 [Exidia glandulosa HHB12029]